MLLPRRTSSLNDMVYTSAGRMMPTEARSGPCGQAAVLPIPAMRVAPRRFSG